MARLQKGLGRMSAPEQPKPGSIAQDIAANVALSNVGAFLGPCERCTVSFALDGECCPACLPTFNKLHAAVIEALGRFWTEIQARYPEVR